MEPKLILSVIAFLASSLIISLWGSLYYKQAIKKNKFPQILVFSAGMMLATALNDLMPHICTNNVHVHSNNDDKHEHSFNPGIFTCGITFILLFLLKNVLDRYSNEKKHNNSFTPEQSSVGNINCCTDSLKKTRSKLQTTIFVLTLSSHSLLEGLGTMNLSRYVALFLHKVVESFSIGITLGSTNFTTFFICFLCVIDSSMIPIGFLIGEIPNINKIDWLLNGMAFGSLIFVIFIEIIPHAFEIKKSSISLVLILCSGFVIPFTVNPIVDGFKKIIK